MKYTDYQENDILDFDIFADSTPEFIDELVSTKLSKTISKNVSERKARSEKPKEVEKQVQKDLRKNSVPSLAESITQHANQILRKYLSQLPRYVDLCNQISELEKSMIQAKKDNNTILLSELTENWKLLTDEKKHWKNLMNSNFAIVGTRTSKFNNIDQIFKNDSLLNMLLIKKESLKLKLKKQSPYYYTEKIRNFREQINLRNLHTNYYVLDLDDDSSFEEDSQMLDTQFSDLEITSEVDVYSPTKTEAFTIRKMNNDTLMAQYEVCCSEIANIISRPKSTVKDMPLGTILSNLKFLLVPDQNTINENRENDIQIMQRRTSLYKEFANELLSISDIVLQNYDLSNPEDERIAKEIMAAAHTKNVKAIAYRICSKNNRLDRFDDSIGYGMLGLTHALNKWLEEQKSRPDVAYSFRGFVNTYIANSIKTGFIEVNSMGAASTSQIQRQNFLLNKRVKNFIDYNPEYANVEPERLRELLADGDEFLANTNFTFESTYDAIGESDEPSNIWHNVCASKENLVQYAESKHDYLIMMKAIKDLLNMFETKFDKATGETYSSGKKLFDEYDTRLFEMAYGFDFKHASVSTNDNGTINSNGSVNYTQAEMAVEIEKMFKSKGMTKTMSQAAVGARLKKIADKLKFIVNNNPKLKRVFEYINKVYHENKEYMEYHSNMREQNGYLFTSDSSDVLKPITEYSNTSFSEVVSNEEMRQIIDSLNMSTPTNKFQRSLGGNIQVVDGQKAGKIIISNSLS